MTESPTIVTCSTQAVAATLAHLRDAGARQQECVVLWLGRPSVAGIEVVSVHRPEQRAAADMFHIPPSSMAQLRASLRRDRVMVAAQVHSHPYEAFHSPADDRWAIVRHVGALSLVVPEFAAYVSVESFLEHTKVFRFSAAAEWLEVSGDEVGKCLQVR
jgi:hypothetical protein